MRLSFPLRGERPVTVSGPFFPIVTERRRSRPRRERGARQRWARRGRSSSCCCCRAGSSGRSSAWAGASSHPSEEGRDGPRRSCSRGPSSRSAGAARALTPRRAEPSPLAGPGSASRREQLGDARHGKCGSPCRVTHDSSCRMNHEFFMYGSELPAT